MKNKTYSWRVVIEKSEKQQLTELAADLGFLVDLPGPQHNQGSGPSLLASLAAAYAADPAKTAAALRAAGITSPDE